MTYDRWHRDDGGAVAVIVAICSLVLFATGALAVDLGQAFQRRRATQTTADLAALAGAQHLPNAQAACRSAVEYLLKNAPSAQSFSLTPTLCPASGNTPDGTVVVNSSGTRIRVVVPPRQVDFGLARVIGFSGTTVNAVATVEIRSPAALVPFHLNPFDAGLTCTKDGSGGGNPSAMRGALLAQPAPPTITDVVPATGPATGGNVVRITGSNFTKNNTDFFFGTPLDDTHRAAKAPGGLDTPTEVDVVVPAGTPNTQVQVTAKKGGNTAIWAGLYTYQPLPAPTSPPQVASVSPDEGPEAGGTLLTVAGTNFVTGVVVTIGSKTVPAGDVAVISPTVLTATTPKWSGLEQRTVDVVVSFAGTTTPPADPDDDDFTYVGECTAASNRGYVDAPRADCDGPQAACPHNLPYNIIAGLDFALEKYDDAPLFTGVYPECGVLPGSLYPNPQHVPLANCLPLQTGNVTSAVTQGYFDGVGIYAEGRMYDLPAGLNGGPLDEYKDYDPVDNSVLGDWVNTSVISIADFIEEITKHPNGPYTPGALKPEIVQSPRFSFMPVLHAPSSGPVQGKRYYPIVDFKAVFISGFDIIGGGSVQSVEGYVFNATAYLPSVVSNSGGDATTPYFGTGPKVPVLVE